MYRLLILTLLCYPCVVITGATWSGDLIIEQRLTLPLAGADEREEWDFVISEWEAARQVALDRLASLPTEDGEERRIVNADIAAFTSQIEDAKRQRGGTILLGRQRYRVITCQQVP